MDNVHNFSTADLIWVVLSWRSHAGSLFTNGEHKRLARDAFETSDTHDGLVYDVTDTFG